MPLNDNDFRVADLSLAGFGRKEIDLAEHEMPGLMATRAEYADDQPLARDVRRALGDYVEALECFRRALAIDPLDTTAQDALLDIEQVLFEFPPEPCEPDGA